jgi:glutamine cyclotransferase
VIKNKQTKYIIAGALVAVAVIFCLFSYNASAQKLKNYKLRVEESYNHDASAYTQGLFFHNGELYETTGQYGSSSIRKVDLKSGRVLNYIPVDKKYFAEGSCVLDGRMYVLTWMEKVGFVYDIATLKKIGEFRNPREGWGITTDGKSLIMSDGSHKIYYLDPLTFMEQKSVEVTLNGKKINYINELEFIGGKIWANVYTTDTIIIIDPASGVVEGVVDCRNLLPYAMRRPNTDVLNGIAWDKKTDSVYLTGKNWPKLFKISLKEIK